MRLSSFLKKCVAKLHVALERDITQVCHKRLAGKKKQNYNPGFPKLSPPSKTCEE